MNRDDSGLVFGVETIFCGAEVPDFGITLSLFADEYKLPLLPPEICDISGYIDRNLDAGSAGVRPADKAGCIHSVVYDGGH